MTSTGRKYLLLGGFLLFIGLGNGGMVPYNNNKNNNGRPNVGKPITATLTFKPDRPEKPVSSHPEGGVVHRPSNFSTSQSIVGNSLSHLVFSQNGGVPGAETVMIVTTNPNGQNETFHVPVDYIHTSQESFSSSFSENAANAVVYYPPAAQSSMEAHPVENSYVTGVTASVPSYPYPQAVQAGDEVPSVETYFESVSTEQFQAPMTLPQPVPALASVDIPLILEAIPENPQPQHLETFSSYIQQAVDPINQVVPSFEQTATAILSLSEPAATPAEELHQFPNPLEGLPTAQETFASISETSHEHEQLQEVNIQQSHVAPTSDPSAYHESFAAPNKPLPSHHPINNEITSEPNTVHYNDNEHGFDLAAYIAQANLVLGSGLPSLAPEPEVTDDGDSLTLAVQQEAPMENPNVPPSNDLSESGSVNNIQNSGPPEMPAFISEDINQVEMSPPNNGEPEQVVIENIGSSDDTDSIEQPIHDEVFGLYSEQVIPEEPTTSGHNQLETFPQVPEETHQAESIPEPVATHPIQLETFSQPQDPTYAEPTNANLDSVADHVVEELSAESPLGLSPDLSFNFDAHQGLSQNDTPGSIVDVPEEIYTEEPTPTAQIQLETFPQLPEETHQAESHPEPVETHQIELETFSHSLEPTYQAPNPISQAASSELPGNDVISDQVAAQEELSPESDAGPSQEFSFNFLNTNSELSEPIAPSNLQVTDEIAIEEEQQVDESAESSAQFSPDLLSLDAPPAPISIQEPDLESHEFSHNFEETSPDAPTPMDPITDHVPVDVVASLNPVQQEHQHPHITSNSEETPSQHPSNSEAALSSHDEDPPFDVQQYLAHAAAVMGGSFPQHSNYGHFDRHGKNGRNATEPEQEASSYQRARARPLRPGLSRPSTLGIAPVYTYSGGKLNTPVIGEDYKVTHGSFAAANSKNENGTLSKLEDASDTPHHAMVSHLGTSTIHSYFNGSQPNVTLPAGQGSKGQTFQITPAALINNALLSGTYAATDDPEPEPQLNATEPELSANPASYQHYYFPQDSVKDNGTTSKGSRATDEPVEEESLIPQLMKSFQDEGLLETESVGQSIFELLAHDRKKAALVRRATASGKSLGLNMTYPDEELSQPGTRMRDTISVNSTQNSDERGQKDFDSSTETKQISQEHLDTSKVVPDIVAGQNRTTSLESSASLPKEYQIEPLSGALSKDPLTKPLDTSKDVIKPLSEPPQQPSSSNSTSSASEELQKEGTRARPVPPKNTPSRNGPTLPPPPAPPVIPEFPPPMMVPVFPSVPPPEMPDPHMSVPSVPTFTVPPEISKANFLQASLPSKAKPGSKPSSIKDVIDKNVPSPQSLLVVPPVPIVPLSTGKVQPLLVSEKVTSKPEVLPVANQKEPTATDAVSDSMIDVEKALSSKRPLSSALNAAQANTPAFQNPPPPVETVNPNIPEKTCSCTQNNNPTTDPAPGKNSIFNSPSLSSIGDKHNHSPTGSQTPSKGTNSPGFIPGKNTPSHPIPAPTPVPSIEPIGEISNGRPPRPSKPKRPLKPNGSSKKPKPKPGDKNYEKFKDVEVPEEEQPGQVSVPTGNKLEMALAPPNTTSPDVNPPPRQSDLFSVITVFGWEIPVLNWAYFTKLFRGFFVERFRTSAGEFTCNDSVVSDGRSEIEMDFLCGEDADFSKDIVAPLESGICYAFCSSNGFSGGMCMPQRSCLCFMTEKKNFAIKLDKLHSYGKTGSNATDSSESSSCEKCSCLKSCKNAGKYVGYCSKSCHCGVPWYNDIQS